MARKQLRFFSYLLLQLRWLRLALLISLGILGGLICHLLILGIGVQPVGAKIPIVNPIVQVLPNESRSLQKAKELYEAKQFLEAATLLQQAASDFETQGDTLNQARVLSDLSLAYQQLGQWPDATSAIAQSLKLLQQNQGNSRDRLKILAQALNTQGSLQLAVGQSEQALATWQQATATYTQIGDDTGIIRSQINQTQAMRALGFYRQALTTLKQTRESLQTQPDSLIKVAGLRSLGSTLRLIGDLDESQQVLQQSLDLAKNLNSPLEISATLFTLGNLAQTKQDTAAALTFYQQAASISPSPTTKVQAELNQLSLLIDHQQWADSQNLLPQIRSQIDNLPVNRTTLYAQINFVRSLTRLKQAISINTPSWSEIAKVLATTIQQAQSLGDQRAEANALGSLGGLYEQTQQWSNAQELTEKALLLAQAINAPDVAYRWQWQLGRLLQAQGNRQKAIIAYSEAVKTLKSLRSELVAINPDVQFSFRESVEPVYRELVNLLLQPGSPEPSQQNLVQARDVIESLQIAELENFFREACLETKLTQVDQVDTQAAVIYTIILSDRLEVILSLPQQPLRHYATTLSQAKIDDTVEQLRKTLVIRSKRQFMPLSQEVYNWLIRPAEADLAQSKVSTLVFVLEGSLRNLPMAVLNDGQQYLVEKYSIALTPGLRLVDPKPLQRGQLKALTAGLTEARQGFTALENVGLELKEINSQVPTTTLLNQEFTTSNFQKQIESASFPVVHIATHGNFSSKAVETFILTWNNRINVNQLDTLLQAKDVGKQKAIELLVLSACETATGDKRAALGLAGLAVRAGARSTLATLWSINDAGTADLMGQFYQELAKPSMTKAEALRRAQLSLLQDPLYKHPIYWAPYVMVGNWL